MSGAASLIVRGFAGGGAVTIVGDRIATVGPAPPPGAATTIDLDGATLVPARVELALALDLPVDPAEAALAAFEQLQALRLGGVAGARVYAPAAVLAPLIAAADRLLLPRLRAAGPTLRCRNRTVEVIGLRHLAGRTQHFAADDPALARLAHLPGIEAIEGDPPPALARIGAPLLRDVTDAAAFLGFDDLGRIAPGCRADLLAVAADGTVRVRIVAGCVLP